MQQTDPNVVEKKQAEASRYRGVSYDRRIDKFIAMMRIGGVSQYLGSFETAAEASVCYDTEREAQPVTRARRTNTFRAHFELFKQNAVYELKDGHKHMVLGQIMVAPDGQQFCLRRIQFFKMKGSNKRQSFLIFVARCRVCGEMYEVMVLEHADRTSGLARNCAAHKGSVEGQAWPAPADWGVGTKPFESKRIPPAFSSPRSDQSEGSNDDQPDFYDSCSDAEKKYFDDAMAERANAAIAKAGVKPRTPAVIPVIDALVKEIKMEIVAARAKGDNSDLV